MDADLSHDLETEPQTPSPAPNVLRGMGLAHLAKNERAKKELAEKGMALGQD
jgi:hypothetical protein